MIHTVFRPAVKALLKYKAAKKEQPKCPCLTSLSLYD